MAELAKVYKEKVVPKLKERFGYKSAMQVPRIMKITLNMGVGEAVADKKIIQFAVDDLARISGQKPLITKSKKSIAGFKIREDWPVGCKVTMRRERMYDFMRRLVTIAIPRIRDFRGFSVKSFDGRGNYNIGIKEWVVFPEVDYDTASKIYGLNITIQTSTNNDKHAYALLKSFGMPFAQKNS